MHSEESKELPNPFRTLNPTGDPIAGVEDTEEKADVDTEVTALGMADIGCKRGESFPRVLQSRGLNIFLSVFLSASVRLDDEEYGVLSPKLDCLCASEMGTE